MRTCGERDREFAVWCCSNQRVRVRVVGSEFAREACCTSRAILHTRPPPPAPSSSAEPIARGGIARRFPATAAARVAPAPGPRRADVSNAAPVALPVGRKGRRGALARTEAVGVGVDRAVAALASLRRRNVPKVAPLQVAGAVHLRRGLPLDAAIVRSREVFQCKDLLLPAWDDDRRSLQVLLFTPLRHVFVREPGLRGLPLERRPGRHRSLL